MSAAHLIALGVEVEADQDEAGTSRPFGLLGSLIRESRDEADGLREVLQMLIDAADGAADMHRITREPTTQEEHDLREDVARAERFSALLKSALFEVRS